jgi:chemotaxis protein methyltransferase CheR
MVTDITDEEMNSLTQSILKRYGIDFTCYEPKSLRRRIIRVLNLFELPCIHDLWVAFLRDQNFIHLFMNEISVGMTSMFRDPVLWKNLRSRLGNEFAHRSDVSVWHAGCSTGEEVFSFGILSSEAQLHNATRVLATDFNVKALEEARGGSYHRIKMIENESNYRDFNPFKPFSSYYNTEGTYSKMDGNLIKSVDFKYHNLITDVFPTAFDLIFCRNVMIYFDNDAKNKLLDKFHKALNPGGYLVIGFFDTMVQVIDKDRFHMADEDAKIFQKI